MSTESTGAQPAAHNCNRCNTALVPGSHSCAGCGLAFDLPVPGAELVVTPPPPVATGPASPWLAPERTAALQVRLASGQAYTVQEILLFDQGWLTAAANYKAQGIEKLGGYQSGLGSIGSLGHVLTSSLIIGSVEGIVSSGMRKEGIRLLEHAENLALQSRNYCHFFHPAQIFSVELPIPEMWQAMLPVSPTETRRFVHNGDPMVTVRLSDRRILSLIWDKVESYEQSPYS